MPFEKNFNFSLSIVSHGHHEFVSALLQDLARLNRNDIEVILTWNKGKEGIAILEKDFAFSLVQIENKTPEGFAANHNAAFQHNRGRNFVILNPDIRIFQDPFPALLELAEKNYPCICAPIILNTDSVREDSARLFPSPFSLFKKAAARLLKYQLAHDKIPEDDEKFCPDWIAGMFMVVPSEVYRRLNGLSEKYYLYYEDVDFCARAKLSGIGTYMTKKASAMHDARRESHRNFEFFKWHMTSAIKFFISKNYIRLILNRMHDR